MGWIFYCLPIINAVSALPHLFGYSFNLRSRSCSRMACSGVHLSKLAICRQSRHFFNQDRQTLTMIFSKKPLNKKILLWIMLPIAVVSTFTVWDHWRLENDFRALFSMLNKARFDALYNGAQVIVRFDGSNVVSTSNIDKNPVKINITTIRQVDYDTTLGDNMIVFGTQGTTSEHNKRIHGGEIMLKSILGFKRYIHVNCNGYVREGRYPED
jgi:Tfp pilus assembly protein FimT